MKIHHIFAGVSGFAMLATACLAAPSDIISSRRADFFAPGRHQFYVWCGSGKDRIVYQDGASAEDASRQLLLSEKSDASGCQPVWQGRIRS